MRRLFTAILSILVCTAAQSRTIRPAEQLYIDPKAASQSKEYIAELKAKAEGGNHEAQWYLSIAYKDGLGVETNYNESYYWAAKAAKSGDAEMLYSAGNAMLRTGHRWKAKKAAKYFAQAVKKEHAPSKYRLGQFYIDGYGVKMNTERGSELIHQAANQDVAAAQYYLAKRYKSGTSFLPQDTRLAIFYYELAARQGHSNAQNDLGNIYYNGKLVTKDYDKAVMWYTKSAEGGNKYGQCNLGNCYRLGRGVEKNYEMAAKWYAKSATQGWKNAQYQLGLLYYYGRGVAKNYKMAFEHLSKAAEQEHSGAYYYVGFCYDNGRGVEQDLARAMEFYAAAAESGDIKAHYRLGVLYAIGKGCLKDAVKAHRHYTIAAEGGNKSAAFYLGEQFQNGVGCTQDIEKAKYWYQKAADKGHKYAIEALKDLQ